MAYIPPIRTEVDFTAAPWPADYIPPLRTEVDFVSYGGPLPPALIEGDGVCTIELLCTGAGEFYPIITGNGAVFIDFTATGGGAVGRSASGEAGLSLSAAGEGEVVPFFTAEGSADISLVAAGNGATFVYRDASALATIKLTAAGSGAIGRSGSGGFAFGLTAAGLGASRGFSGQGAATIMLVVDAMGDTYAVTQGEADVRLDITANGFGSTYQPQAPDEITSRHSQPGLSTWRRQQEVINVLR